MLSGRTRQGKLVHFVAPGTGGLDAGHASSTVRIEHAAPHHLAGTLVSVEAVAEPPGCGSGSRWSPAEDPLGDCSGRQLPTRIGRSDGAAAVQWPVVSVFGKVLRAGESKKVRSLAAIVPSINALEPEIQALSDDELADKTVEFRERLDQGEDLNDLLVEAFAVVREAACAHHRPAPLRRPAHGRHGAALRVDRRDEDR